MTILMPAGRAVLAAGKGAAGRAAAYLGFIHAADAGGSLTDGAFNIGAASADRVIVAALGAQLDASGRTVVVNGVTLTQRIASNNLGAAMFSDIVASGTIVAVSASHAGFADAGLVLWSVTGVASATPKASAASGGVFETGADIAVAAGDFLMLAGEHTADWFLAATTEAVTVQRATEGSGFRVGGAYKLGITSSNASFHIGNDTHFAAVTF